VGEVIEMELGKQIRLNRIFNKKSGRLLVVAIDHPIARGVLPGIAEIEKVMGQIVKGKPDAITMHKGIAKNCFCKYVSSDIPFLLKCTSFSPYHQTNEALVADVEEAIAFGAEGISVGVILGGQYQSQMLHNLGKISHKADLYGLPLFAHIYPKGEFIKDQYSSDNVAYATRVASELGVDVVKTFYTGSKESFEKVIKVTPIKVAIAGGENVHNNEALFKMTKDAIDAGAVGITYGRSIWQSANPTKMIEALKIIVHENGSVQDALNFWND
jgi:class I fructose-bisphosphate aldolase